MPRVTVVCNQKGGVGKTTLAVGLAAANAQACAPIPPPELDGSDVIPSKLSDAQAAALLRRFKPQVLGVSTDPQESMTYWLGRVERALHAARRPMPIDYAQEHKNPRVLASLKSGRRYMGGIWVDSPGWLEGVDEDEEQEGQQILAATLESADFAVIPTEPEDMAFPPTKRTIEEVIKPRRIPFLVVINNWDPRDGDGDLKDTQTRIRRQGWPLAKTVVRRYKVHTSASASGRLITSYPRNRVAVEARSDLMELALELAKAQGS